MYSKLTFAITTLFIVLSVTSCKKENEVNKIQSASSVDALTTTSKLVAWYTFDGDTLDHSGYNNNINFSNAKPTIGMKGVANSAYYFDGSKSYMTIPNSNSINPKQITVSVLVKPNGFYQGLCHRNTILYKALDDNSTGRYMITFDDQAYYNFDGCYDSVQSKFQNFTGSIGDSQAGAAGTRDPNYIKQNAWYLVTFTYDGQNFKLYENDKLVAVSQGSTSFTPSQIPVYIGKSPDINYPYNFRGVIDEIRIYSFALSQADVQHLYKIVGN